MTDLPLAGAQPAISEIDPEMLTAWLAARGEPAYRAAQILAGSHRPTARSLDDLTDLPRPLRGAVADAFSFSSIAGSHVLVADGGLTAKAVHELSDGQRIESVLMRYPSRRGRPGRTTVCISSQAGCAVNCPFCATGQAGFGRQLTAGEIVDQVLHWHRDPWLALGADWRPGGGRSHYNIVFMGMGEPLNNADRVFDAVRLLNDPSRLGIGARHITVSTSGVVPGIDRMVDELPQVNLAISLHAASDELRDELVPINRKYPIRLLLAACLRYIERAPRDFVTFEYVMLDHVNDAPEQARELASLVRDVPCKFNLIPFNPFPNTEYRTSSRNRIVAFQRILQDAGLVATIRKTRGEDIDAACGQLAGQVQDRTKRRLHRIQPVARA